MTAPGPALTAATLVLAACAIAFALTTALRHNDVAGRLWSSANVAFLCACGVAAAQAFDAGPDIVLQAAAAGAIVLGPALLLAGLRAFAGRAPSLGVPLVVAGLVVGLRLVPDLVPADVVDGVALLAGAALAALGVQALASGPMVRNLHVLLLRITLALLAVLLVAAAVVRFAGREETPRAFVLVAMLVAVVVQCLVAMRVERHGSWWSTDAVEERRSLDVLGRDRFLASATDRLERLGLVGGDAALVVTGVDDLDAVNDAFGRTAGDEVLVTLSSVVRSHVPPWAVVGHLGAGTFAVLTPVDAPGGGREVAEAVERGLLALRRDEAGVPVAATSGHADTFSSPADVDRLVAAALADRARVS